MRFNTHKYTRYRSFQAFDDGQPRAPLYVMHCVIL